MDDKIQIVIFHPKDILLRLLFLSSKNVCSFSLLDDKIQIVIFHPKDVLLRAFFLSSKNVCSFSLAQSQNSANSGDGLNDLVISMFSKRYKPLRVLTRERTTYSQFLKVPPFGQDVIITTSLLIPCNLCPVVASFEFIGNCVILHLNSCSTAMR